MYQKYAKLLLPLAWIVFGTLMLFNRSDHDGQQNFSRSLRVLQEGSNDNNALTTPSREWYHEADCPLKDMSLLLPMHHKDFPLASTLFNSLEKVFPCFKELVVVVPPESKFALAGGVPSYARVVLVPDPLPAQFGYLSQQVIKLYADLYTTGSRVLILEADLIMKHYSESCFFSVDQEGNYNGKVRAYCSTQGYAVWYKGTHHAIGGDPIDMDCCMNSPFAFPRDVFPAFRDYIERTHGKRLGEFMEDYFEGHTKAWTPQDKLFSEFNILSHYMIRHHPEWVEVVTPESGHEKFEVQRHLCSDHQAIHRDHSLPNPKLTSAYFDNYYHILDSTLGSNDETSKRVTLDIGKEWDIDYVYVNKEQKQANQDATVAQANTGVLVRQHDSLLVS